MTKTITWRAILLALVLTPVNIKWVTQYEVVLVAGSPTTLSIFYTSVVILLLLVGINALIRRLRPSLAFSRGELLLVYMVMNVSASICSHDFLQVLLANLPHPLRYATAENHWHSLIINRIPDWAIVKDKAAVDAFYLGNDSFFQWKYLRHWIQPLSVWSGFIMTLFYTFLCINSIIRKQWSENEKLSFPLISIPLELTGEKGSFFRDPVMYIGLGVAFVFTIVQGLSTIWPSFPIINLKNIDLAQYMVNPPFNAIGLTPVRVYPIAVGITFLVPADLSFSYWFFYLFMKCQYIFGAAVGINTIRNYPFIPEQCFGFFVGIFVFAVIMARGHLRTVFATVFANRKADDAREPMGYRHAVWGLILGMCAMMLFARILGQSPVLAVCFVTGYLIICFSLTRTRAELGCPCHEVNSSSITEIIMRNAGTSILGARNVIGLQIFFWCDRCFRSNMMPVQLESFKMAEHSGMSYRKLSVVLMAAAFAALMMGYAIVLDEYYRYGAAANMAMHNVIFGSELFKTMESALKNGSITDWNGVGASVTGFVSCLALSFARIRIPGFPFNPIAYAMMSSAQTRALWSSAMIAWLCKVIILKYGGLRVFTRALPFFLGLILGDCLAGSFWCIVSIILHAPTYSIFP